MGARTFSMTSSRERTRPATDTNFARGATALTEAWDANPGNSQNHFMLGHAETGLFGGLACIRRCSYI
jgi:alpha-L-rhamnosidase